MRTRLSNTETRVRRILDWAYGCYAWTVFAVVLLASGGLAILLAAIFRNPARGRRVMAAGARLLFKLAGMPVSAKGLDKLPSEPHILVVNHSSFMDPIALSALLPPAPGYAFTARQQFPAQRLLCPLLRALGTLVFEPTGQDKRRFNVARMARCLKRGENLVIFPEGGFTREPGIKRFRSGAFIAAASSGRPLVVAALCGARAAVAPGAWLPRRTAITLEIGPSFRLNSKDPAAVSKTRAAAHRAMVALSGEPDASSRPQP